MRSDAIAAERSADDVGRTRRRLIGSLLVSAGVVAAVVMLTRPLSSPELESLSEVTGARAAQWWFALVCGAATAVAYAASGAAAWALVRGRGSRWALVGATSAALGGLLFCAGFFAYGALNWYATAPDTSPATFEVFRDDPVRVFGVQAVGFVLGATGVVLLGVGLWRARTVPRWLAGLIGLGPVLMVTLGDDGRLYDVLYAGHMATLAALGVLVLVRRPAETPPPGSSWDPLAAPGPAFRGIDHLALTVTDVERSARFYVDVLGFTAVLESEGAVLCVHKGTAFTLGLVQHQGATGQPFSHLTTGLDHLGLLARDRAELEDWARRFREHGVPFDGIVDETLGHHLHVRDPDGIALELYAPNDVYAAARDELRSRPFTDDELRMRAGQLLGLDTVAEPPVRLARE